MSNYKFEPNAPIYKDFDHKPHAHIFNVVAVDVENRATLVKTGPEGVGLSEGMNYALEFSGATGAVLGKEDDTIELYYGHRTSSPNFSPSRDY